MSADTIFNAGVGICVTLVSIIGGMIIHELRQIRNKLENINDTHIRHDEKINHYGEWLKDHEHRLTNLEK